MDKLEILNAMYDCGIGNEGIKKLNLKKLYACENPRITKEGFKHMTNLEFVKLDSLWNE